MEKYIIVLLAFSFFTCKSFNSKSVHEEMALDSSTNYYTIIYFNPGHTHTLSMGGIGSRIDIQLLDTSGLQNFVESFYKQLAYAPHIIDVEYSYPKTLNCLGYSIKWNEKYSLSDIYSEVISEHTIKLDDSIYVNMKMFAIMKDLKILYIEDFDDCISPSSIELDMTLIKSIDKVAILVDEVN